MQIVQHRTVNAPIERLFDLVRSIQAHEATSSIDGQEKPLVCCSGLSLNLSIPNGTKRLEIY
jgi:hypothetical protein